MALSSAALVTLAQLKSFLGIDGTHNDTRLELNIEAASRTIQNYIGYSPVSQSYTDEFHEGDGTDRIYTKARPITAITTITVEDGSVDTSGVSNRTTYIDLEGYAPTRGAEILVDYTAGYSTIPYDMQMACLQIAGYYEAQQDTTGLNALSSRSNDTTSRTLDDGFIDRILGALVEYQRVM